MEPKELKKARFKRGWTQSQMAHEMGISQGRLSDFESGRRKIPSYIAKLIEYMSREEIKKA